MPSTKTINYNISIIDLMGGGDNKMKRCVGTDNVVDDDDDDFSLNPISIIGALYFFFRLFFDPVVIHGPIQYITSSPCLLFFL